MIVKLKPLLTKLMYEIHSVPYAQMRGICATNTAVTTGSWYTMSQFTGATKSYHITDSNYYAEDPNGIKILKKGTYKLDVNVYFVASATNTGFGVSFYNDTDQSIIGDSRYVYAPSSAAWGSVTNTYYIRVTEKPTIILPRFQRQSGSANIRPSSCVFSVMLIKDNPTL